jgi:hypothetical protein
MSIRTLNVRPYSNMSFEKRNRFSKISHDEWWSVQSAEYQPPPVDSTTFMKVSAVRGTNSYNL